MCVPLVLLQPTYNFHSVTMLNTRDDTYIIPLGSGIIYYATIKTSPFNTKTTLVFYSGAPVLYLRDYSFKIS